MKSKRTLELEVLIPNIIAQIRNTPKENVEAYALANSRLYELSLEYKERTGHPYRIQTEEERKL